MNAILIDGMFNKPKHSGRIATGYDQTALSCLASFNLAAMCLWLK